MLIINFLQKCNFATSFIIFWRLRATFPATERSNCQKWELFARLNYCNYSSKLDCKEQNGYTNIKPDIGAGAPGVPGWGGSAPVRPSVCTPDMTRYTPSSVDQVARDRAWMNTCSSLSAAAQALTTSTPQLLIQYNINLPIFNTCTISTSQFSIHVHYQPLNFWYMYNKQHHPRNFW